MQASFFSFCHLSPCVLLRWTRLSSTRVGRWELRVQAQKMAVLLPRRALLGRKGAGERKGRHFHPLWWLSPQRSVSCGWKWPLCCPKTKMCLCLALTLSRQLSTKFPGAVGCPVKVLVGCSELYPPMLWRQSCLHWQQRESTGLV